MAQVNHLAIIEVAPLSSSKSTGVDDANNQVMQAMADRASLLISTTDPFLVAASVYARAYEFSLDNHGTPPVADFTVQFAKRISPALHRGPVKIINNTSFIATLEVESQSSAKPTLEAGQTGYYEIYSNEIIANLATGTSQALDWKASVRAATTAALTLATDVENGDTIDGVSLVTGNRVLIQDQASGEENGLYTVNASGAPTRTTDADTDSKVTSGLSVHVEEGTTNADKNFQLTTNNPITLDTTALVFAELSGGGGGTDADAIHDNVAAEISVITEKVAPVNADLVIIEDSDDSNNKKRAQLGNLPGSGGVAVGVVATIVTRDFGAASGTSIDVDITGYEYVEVVWEGVGYAVADGLALRVSTDGVSFDSGASDYNRELRNHTSNTVDGGSSEIAFQGGSAVTSGDFGRTVIRNSASSSYKTQAFARCWNTGSGLAMARHGHRVTAQIDTHIKIFSLLGNTINAGIVRVTGIKSEAVTHIVDLDALGAATFIVDLADDISTLVAGDVLEVDFIDIEPTSDDAVLYMEVSDDDQVSWEATNYDSWVNSEKSASTGKGTSTARLDIVDNTTLLRVNTGIGEHYNGKLSIYGLLATETTTLIGEGVSGDATGNQISQSARGTWKTANAITDLRFTLGSNFVIGKAIFRVRRES